MAETTNGAASATGATGETGATGATGATIDQVVEMLVKSRTLNSEIPELLKRLAQRAPFEACKAPKEHTNQLAENVGEYSHLLERLQYGLSIGIGIPSDAINPLKGAIELTIAHVENLEKSPLNDDLRSPQQLQNLKMHLATAQGAIRIALGDPIYAILFKADETVKEAHKLAQGLLAGQGIKRFGEAFREWAEREDLHALRFALLFLVSLGTAGYLGYHAGQDAAALAEHVDLSTYIRLLARWVMIVVSLILAAFCARHFSASRHIATMARHRAVVADTYNELLQGGLPRLVADEAMRSVLQTMIKPPSSPFIKKPESSESSQISTITELLEMLRSKQQ